VSGGGELRVHPAAESFRSVADLYEKARPGYPAAAVALLLGRLGLRPGRTVVDLAAGTGKLTRELVPSGARVVAVEPLAEMRAVLARVVPGAEAVAGTAEALPLPDGSVDAVTVAQAFHWFDPEPAYREIARVLRPGGALALVWNVRDRADPLQASLEVLLDRWNHTAPRGHEQRWRTAAAELPWFGPEELRSFAWEARYTVEQLVERVSSISFVAELEPPERGELLAAVQELVRGREEPFPFPYRTEVYVLPQLER
jgi:SAM-dependent methyltransferase